MSRWIIPASAVAILVSLAVLVGLLAAGATAPEDVAAPPEVEEPEASPQPTPQQEATTPGGLTQPEEEQAAGDEQPTGEEQTVQEEPTTQQAPTAPGPSAATIRITGDAAYYCSAGVVGEPDTVQGQSPATYEVEVETGGTALETVMAACQKISPGTLGVRILYDGEVVARDETAARLGTISVSWNPLEE